jgi:hypothetical protein
MTNQDPLTKATIRLVDILQAENTELRAMDFKAAGRLLMAKQAATADLTAAQAGALYAPAGLQALAERLNELADENRDLLERAIAVQRRVLSTVVRAAQTIAPDPHYGPSGTHAARAVSAVALRANA